MISRILFMVFFLIVFINQKFYGQGFSHELGVIVGPVALYSDFGHRHDLKTNLGNTGVGIGLVHYLNFSYRANCNCYTSDTYFNDHFKVRNEIDLHKTNLKHYGEWVAPEKTSRMAKQLRAMTGSTTVFEIGTQLEYYPFSIRDFAAGGYKFAPFVSAGIHWVHFSPEVKSSIGRLQNAPNRFGELEPSTPAKYVGAFQNKNGSTFAAIASVGVRYKLTKMSDLMLDGRWHIYFSDYVDGLNPSSKNNGGIPVPENKSNDWMFWLNVGYIFYLE